MMTWMILAGLIIGVFTVAVYNRMVRFREMVEEAFSGVDVQLKLRHDLIPRLVETVRGYMDYEAQVLVDVTRQRAEATQAENRRDKARLETDISQGLRSLFSVAERYPDLQASKNFIDLQESLVQVEENIQLSRRYYNGTVRQYNILVQSFPANLIAGMFRFTQKDFFEIQTTGERDVPPVDLSLS